jgi:hypothetical protein
MSEESKVGFERHLQSFLLAIVSGLLLWNVSQTSDTGKTVIKIEGRISNLENNVSSRMLDRYTGTQAQSHSRYMDLQIRNILNRLEKNAEGMAAHEGRIDVLEKPNSDAK